MNKFLLTLLGVFMVACYGSAQSFDQVEKKGKFYLAVDEYYLLDNNPRFGQGATTAAALTLGYTLTPHSGLELSGASLGYEWKNNPRYFHAWLYPHSTLWFGTLGRISWLRMEKQPSLLVARF